MAHICLDCYNVFNIKSERCPIAKCGGEIIEVDELFVDTIIILNQKGYYTKYCCSGHTYKTDNSYIYFHNFVKLPYLPEGYRYDEDIYPFIKEQKEYVKQNVIRNIFTEKDKYKYQNGILRNAQNVLEWAQSLPKFDDYEDDGEWIDIEDKDLYLRDLINDDKILN